MNHEVIDVDGVIIRVTVTEPFTDEERKGLVEYFRWLHARKNADTPPQPSQAASDATSGVPGHPEVSEAVRSPQEPYECSCYKLPRWPDGLLRHHPDCPNNTEGALDPGDPS